MLNPIVSVIVSFVISLLSIIFSFINAFRSAFIIGGIVLLIILAFPTAHAGDLIISCGGYGNIPLQECEGIANELAFEKKVGIIGFFLCLIMGICIGYYDRYKARKELRKYQD